MRSGTTRVPRARAALAEPRYQRNFAVVPAHDYATLEGTGKLVRRAARAWRSTWRPRASGIDQLSSPAGTEPDAPPITRFARFTKHQLSFEGKAMAYVCTNYACKAQTTDAREMLALLLQ